MDKVIGIVTVVALISILVFVLTLPPGNGRYQLVGTEVGVLVMDERGNSLDTIKHPDVFKVDTKTGEMWVLSVTFKGPEGSRKLVYHWKPLAELAPGR